MYYIRTGLTSPMFASHTCCDSTTNGPPQLERRVSCLCRACRVSEAARDFGGSGPFCSPIPAGAPANKRLKTITKSSANIAMKSSGAMAHASTSMTGAIANKKRTGDNKHTCLTWRRRRGSTPAGAAS